MEYREIGKLFSYVSRGKSPKYVDSSEICIINQACIRWDGIDFSKIKYQDSNAYKEEMRLHEGDVLLTSTGTGTLGRCCIFHSPDQRVYIADSHVTILRNTQQLLPKILCLFLRTQKGQEKIYSECVNGSTNQIELSKEKLKKLIIPVHNKEVQQTVIDKTDRISNLISLRKTELIELDTLVKARFVEMFGDPLLDNARYPRVALGSVAEVGSSKRIFEKEYVSDGVPFYRTKEIVELSKGSKISTELFITRERYNEIRREYGVPQAGDLLISAVGTIGIIWIVDGKNDFYFKDGNLLRIGLSQNFNPIHLKVLLEALIGAYKQEMSSGTAYAALTISALKEMLVYEVPIKEQEQFSAFVTQVNQTKSVVQKALDEAQTLFDSLMQQYFG